MIRVDGEVESHELDELLVLSESKEGGQVLGVIGGRVDGGELVSSVGVSVDSTSDVGELGDEIHGVIEGGLPVLSLVDSVLVGLSEGGVVVELREEGERGREGMKSALLFFPTLQSRNPKPTAKQIYTRRKRSRDSQR